MNSTFVNITKGELNDLVARMNKELIDPNTQRIRLFPSNFYTRFNLLDIQLWCYEQARYTIPTTELVEFLKKQINGRTAIEIGSGNGDLGYHLGIPETDSYIQQTEELKSFYVKSGQYVTNPHKDVERLDAIQAIEKYKPQVVVGSWVTQKYNASTPERLFSSEQGSFMYGVDEDMIIQSAEYIHVGNKSAHYGKYINRFPHGEIKLTGYLSRALAPAKNIIQIWEKI